MEHYSTNHFSLNLPVGSGQNNIPHLLEHLANTLKKDFPNASVLDIVFHTELHDNGLWLPNFTVYYSNDSNKAD